MKGFINLRSRAPRRAATAGGLASIDEPVSERELLNGLIRLRALDNFSETW